MMVMPISELIKLYSVMGLDDVYFCRGVSFLLLYFVAVSHVHYTEASCSLILGCNETAEEALLICTGLYVRFAIYYSIGLFFFILLVFNVIAF